MTPATEKAAPIPADERLWTKWRDNRPPNAAGVYRYRCRIKLLGIICTPEWSEKMTICGMGYDENEWWPLSACRWDGYRRYITHDGLEWSEAREGDANGITWHGLDLLPCPFTGAEPTVTFSGRYIGAPVWFAEALWIGSPSVPQRRWTDAAKMQAAWNTRADRASQEERVREDERDRLYAEACKPMPDGEENETAAALACAAATWLRLTQGVQPADRARLRGGAS